MNTKKLTFSALLAAISVILLMISGIAPSGKLAVAAVAALLPAAAVISCGSGWGLGCYAVAAILSLILVPGKGTAVIFTVLFGPYSILKCLVERTDKLILKWIIKLIVCNGLLAILYFGFSSVFIDVIQVVSIPLPLIIICVNVVFIVYDLGFTKLISFYCARLGKNFK